MHKRVYMTKQQLTDAHHKRADRFKERAHKEMRIGHSNGQGARCSCTQVKKSNDVITHEAHASWARPAGQLRDMSKHLLYVLPMRITREK
jgi:hypothetical protein